MPFVIKKRIKNNFDSMRSETECCWRTFWNCSCNSKYAFENIIDIVWD